MSFETPQPAQRLLNIQALRGVAALLVVLSHLLVMETKYASAHILGFWANIGLTGVDLFFVISGFIMVYISNRIGTGPKAVADFLFARFGRIYPLYWFVSLALLLVWVWKPDLVFAHTAGQPDIVKSFLLFPNVRPPLLAVGWTLIHELGFYLVFSVFLFFPRRFLPFCLFLWGGILLFGIKNEMNLTRTGPLVSTLFSPIGFEFLAGAFTAMVFSKSKARFAKVVLILGCVVFCVSALMWLSLGVDDMEEHWIRAEHFAIPGAMIVYGLAALPKPLPKWTVKLGDWSYSLYLTHVLSLSLMGRIWYKLQPLPAWTNIFVLMGLVVGSIVVAALTYALIERPLLNLVKSWRKQIFH